MLTHLVLCNFFFSEYPIFFPISFPPSLNFFTWRGGKVWLKHQNDILFSLKLIVIIFFFKKVINIQDDFIRELCF